MSLFLERVESYILSDDIALRDFSLRNIQGAKLGSEHTFDLILAAADKAEPEADAMINKVLPYASHIPFTENMLQELITRLKKNDDKHIWYLMLVINCDSYLLHKYSEELENYLEDDLLKTARIIATSNSEELLAEIDKTLIELNKNEYVNKSLYNFGKKIYQELIRRGEIEHRFEEGLIVNLKNEAGNEYISYETLFKIYVAGELKLDAPIPELAPLLFRHNESLLVQEVTHTLIKIGSPRVLPFIEEHLQQEDTFYTAINIFKNIKDPYAEEILLNQFDLVTDNTEKTLIADALTNQLSAKSIPKIAALIEQGYDESAVDLNKVLYINCVINGIEYPHFEESKNKQTTQSEIPTKKVGRNDPCPCGSGKKYKKCCGA